MTLKKINDVSELSKKDRKKINELREIHEEEFPEEIYGETEEEIIFIDN